MSAPAPQPKKSNAVLFASLGAIGCLGLILVAAVAGGGYWYLRSQPGTPSRTTEVDPRNPPANPPPPTAVAPPPVPSGPDLSTPEKAGQAFIDAMNAKDLAALKRISGGPFLEKLEKAVGKEQDAFRATFLGIDKMVPLTTQDGSPGWEIHFNIENRGRRDTMEMGFLKHDGEWRAWGQ